MFDEAKMISQKSIAFYQQFLALPVLVTALAKGKDNAMAVTLHTLLSPNPPIYGVAIAPERFTYQLIVDSKEFVVNFLPFGEAELVDCVGNSSGREIDKFQRFNIAKDKSVRIAAPILKAAYAAYECQLIDDRGYGDHRWLVGEIVAVHWLKGVFTPDEVLDLDMVSPTLTLGYGCYYTVSKDGIHHAGHEVCGKV